MGYEDEDFIVRQAKQMGELLGGFLGKKDTEAILSFGEEAQTEEPKEDEPHFEFRSSNESDITTIGVIVNEAKNYLTEQGSPQWQNGHEPHEAIIREDLKKEASYVLTMDDEIVGTVALISGVDPVYEAIEGAWQEAGPYVALHHVAVSQKYRGAGIGEKTLKAAIEKAEELGFKDIRIDTYPANQPMLGLIGKLGFNYCGMIYFPYADGERKAFQLIKRSV
ncbi:GNAT family N-acetyltransferase [Enterococcus hermanniensis]|uniref:N-acetyltransferase domain-containing protein n=1 Tax=Enterococcus hermanniensis TaxID=249189 RepID=A0A1L8TQ15_9ENTE|nr:GNAT family N-acetyltransferase [Enterococcus hermanniensis]OJG46419.1 hypothetical protein RV04_GL000847 [Enterococcus hermanniensis]